MKMKVVLTKSSDTPGVGYFITAEEFIKYLLPSTRVVSDVIEVDFPMLPEPSVDEKLREIEEELVVLEKEHEIKRNNLIAKKGKIFDDGHYFIQGQNDGGGIDVIVTTAIES